MFPNLISFLKCVCLYFHSFNNYSLTAFLLTLRHCSMRWKECSEQNPS